MENQRVRLSKSLLKDALVDLLQTKKIEKITIYELCKVAQINRSTFYKYYGNQYDLLLEIEQDCLEDINSYIISHEPVQNKSLLQVLEYIEAEERKFKVLFNTGVDNKFPEKLFSLPIIVSSIYSNTPKDYEINDREYVHLFICYGGFAIIRDWLNKEEKRPINEVAEVIRNIILSILKLNF